MKAIEGWKKKVAKAYDYVDTPVCHVSFVWGVWEGKEGPGLFLRRNNIRGFLVPVASLHVA